MSVEWPKPENLSLVHLIALLVLWPWPALKIFKTENHIRSAIRTKLYQEWGVDVTDVT